MTPSPAHSAPTSPIASATPLPVSGCTSSPSCAPITGIRASAESTMSSLERRVVLEHEPEDRDEREQQREEREERVVGDQRRVGGRPVVTELPEHADDERDAPVAPLPGIERVQRPCSLHSRRSMRRAEVLLAHERHGVAELREPRDIDRLLDRDEHHDGVRVRRRAAAARPRCRRGPASARRAARAPGASRSTASSASSPLAASPTSSKPGVASITSRGDPRGTPPGRRR